MVKYELTRVEKKDVALASDKSTLLNDVITMVDLKIMLEDESEDMPLSMVMPEPDAATFTPMSDLTKAQIIEWVTSQFVEGSEAHFEKVLLEKKNAVQSSVSTVDVSTFS